MKGRVIQVEQTATWRTFSFTIEYTMFSYHRDTLGIGYHDVAYSYQPIEYILRVPR